MSDQETAAIPYAGEMVGGWRRLDLVLRRAPTLSLPPTVSIDGQEHVVEWGRVGFEVPADRPVQVEVWIRLNRRMGRAGFLLDPGMPPALEYAGPAYSSADGSLGPPGTVRRRGKVKLGCVLGLLVLAAVPLLALLVGVVVAVVH